MIGRASISMRNLSFAVRIENPPGIDCGLFGGYKETDPRNIMFCTLRNFSPPCAVNAAFASSSGVLSAVITTAGGAAAVAVVTGAAPFAVPCSCAETTPATQTNSARDFKNWLFIYKPFHSEVQSHLCVNASIAGAGTTTAATKPTKRGSHTQRLTKTWRREIADGRPEIHVVQKVLEID